MPSSNLASRAVLRALALIAVVTAGCIRANAPDEFQCSEDSDCLDSEKCSYKVTDDHNRVCVPDDYCRTISECSAVEACLEHVCTPVECSVLNLASCGELQLCRDYECVDVECTAERQEACDRYTCDVLEGSCHTSCGGSATCASGFVCRDERCIEPECSGLTDMEECDGRICIAGLCEPCDNLNRPCPFGYECIGAVCQEKTAELGLPCDDSITCIGGVCCSGRCGEQCGALGAACDDDHECETHNCELGECVPLAGLGDGAPCKGDAQCGNGGRCWDGKCHDPAENGRVYQLDVDCVSSSCCWIDGARTCASTCIGANGGYSADLCDVEDDCYWDGNFDVECIEGYYCAKVCGFTNDTGCGESPTGYSNECVNGFCRPGCASDADCALYGSDFGCFDVTNFDNEPAKGCFN